jgi:S-formylglutathione hydrolase FrmB
MLHRSLTRTALTGAITAVAALATAGGAAARAPRFVATSRTAHQRPSITATYLATGTDGIAAYRVVSPQDGSGSQILRVLKPTDPAPGVPHNFLYVLPVETGTGDSYGDGIETLAALDAQDKYNLTIVEPSFPVEPWYADNPTNHHLQYETFMTRDLVPWVTAHLASSGKEQNWLIGFSKSGFGAQDLILKHPGVFTAAASWDFPANMDTSTSDHGLTVGNGVDYGSNANFQSNYRLSARFVHAHRAAFRHRTRLWIGGYAVFRKDVTDYGRLLRKQGIKHTTGKPVKRVHRWDSGWVATALQALSHLGAKLPAGP